MELPDPVVVFLVGAPGSGKSTWARGRFLSEEIVSSDSLRAVVGSGEGDIDASADAFRILRIVAEARIGRRLTTVIDTTGLDPDLRADVVRWARDAAIPAVAVKFDPPLAVCRRRNRERLRPVPAGVLASQHKRVGALPLDDEGWDRVEVETSDDSAGASTAPVISSPVGASARPGFVLHVSRFSWREPLADQLVEIARAAEAAGFDGISVMDHLVQIPQVGRSWEDIPEPYTALAFVAGVTRTLELGTLVTNVTLRNLGMLAKSVATLDVLSGGRTFCGLGAGWNVEEEAAYGYPATSTRGRLDQLEDAVRLLPRMWGAGAVDFEGHGVEVRDAVTYPRPLRERIPVIVGGGGERRTLRIAAEHADAVNLIGTPDTVAHKRTVLDRYCRDIGRDPAEVEVTILDVTLVGEDRRTVADLVEAHRGRTTAPVYAARVNAGTVDSQVERYARMVDSGIDCVFVALPDLQGPEQVERFGRVLAGLRSL